MKPHPWNSPGTPNFDNTLTQITNAVIKAKEIVQDSEFVGFLFAGGKSDIYVARTKAQHEIDFQSMVNNFRNGLSKPDAFVIIGGLPVEWVFNSDANINRIYKQPIYNAQLNIPNLLRKTSFVPGLVGIDKVVTTEPSAYTREASREMGIKMFKDGYTNAIQNN